MSLQTSMALAMQAALEAAPASAELEAMLARMRRALKPFGFTEIERVSPFQLVAVRPYRFPSTDIETLRRTTKDVWAAIGRDARAVEAGGIRTYARGNAYVVEITLAEQTANV